MNADHYTNAVLHDPGTHRLTTEQYDTDYVQVSIRILADPNDPDDMATVHGQQDAVEVSAGSAVPFTHPEATVTPAAWSRRIASATASIRGWMSCSRHIRLRRASLAVASLSASRSRAEPRVVLPMLSESDSGGPSRRCPPRLGRAARLRPVGRCGRPVV